MNSETLTPRQIANKSRPFSTPYLNKRGRITERNMVAMQTVISKRKISLDANGFKVIKWRINCVKLDSSIETARKIYPSKYLLMTIDLLEKGIANAKLFHLDRSS